MKYVLYIMQKLVESECNWVWFFTCCHTIVDFLPPADKHKILNADCDSLLRFEVTREDFLEAAQSIDESKVHSTTPDSTPTKKKTPKRKGRSTHLKRNHLTDTESDLFDYKPTPAKKQKICNRKQPTDRAALIQSSQEQARQMFSISDDEEQSEKEIEDLAMKKLVQDQAKVIKKLQEQLQAQSSKYSVVKFRSQEGFLPYMDVCETTCVCYCYILYELGWLLSRAFLFQIWSQR